jgi:hypothetical protein
VPGDRHTHRRTGCLRSAYAALAPAALCALLLAGISGRARAAEPHPTERRPLPAAAPRDTARRCRATAKKQWIAVHLTPPKGVVVTAVNIVVDYPNAMLSIPRDKGVEKVKSRIGRLPANAITGITDLGTTLRVVLGKSPKLPAGEVFTVEFDRCDGADRATAEDFQCTVVAASNPSGPVQGATCAVVVP